MPRYNVKIQTEHDIVVEADSLIQAEALAKFQVSRSPASKLMSIYVEGYVAPPETTKPVLA